MVRTTQWQKYKSTGHIVSTISKQREMSRGLSPILDPVKLTILIIIVAFADFLLPWPYKVSLSVERSGSSGELTGGGKGKMVGTVWHVHKKNFWGSD